MQLEGLLENPTDQATQLAETSGLYGGMGGGSGGVVAAVGCNSSCIVVVVLVCWQQLAVTTAI